MKAFDPFALHFNITQFQMDGLNARIWQGRPLASPPPSASSAGSSMPGTSTPAYSAASGADSMTLALGRILLAHIRLDYRNTGSAFSAYLDLGQLAGESRHFDLARKLVDLKELRLDSTTVAIGMGRPPGARGSVTGSVGSAAAGSVGSSAAASQSKAGSEQSSGSDWHIVAGALSLNGDNFKYDDNTRPRQLKGMDYSHLKIDRLTLQANRVLYNKDTISGVVTEGRFTEQSGFRVDHLQTEFLYAANQAWLKGLGLKTPGTLVRSTISMKYPSLSGIMSNPARTFVDIDLQDSKIQVKDILTFAPFLQSQPAFSHPADTWDIDARLKGSLAALRAETLRVSGPGDIKIALSGMLSNLTNTSRLAASLENASLSGTSKGLASLLPANVLPAGIALPEKFSMQGKLGGSMNEANADLAIRSTAGDIALKGFIRQFRSPARAVYDASVQMKGLDLGFILKDTANYGPVTADLSVKGQGFDPRTAGAQFSVQGHSVTYNRFEYRNFRLDGSIAGGHAHLLAGIADTAVRFTMNASADLASRFPGVTVDWHIDTLDLHALHFVKDALAIKCHLVAGFPDTNLDSLQGRLRIDSIMLVNGTKIYATDSVTLLAQRSGEREEISLRSEMADMEWEGRFKITELTQALEQTINRYYDIGGGGLSQGSPKAGGVKRELAFTPQDWQLHLRIRPSPVLLNYIPSLKGSDTLGARVFFNSDAHDLRASLQAPLIRYGNQIIHNVAVQVASSDFKMQYKAGFSDFSDNGFRLYQTALYGYLADNRVQASLLLKDSKNKDWYRLAGLLDHAPAGMRFALNPDSLLLNYDQWQVSRDNFIQYDSAGLFVNDFVISNRDESMHINSSRSDSSTDALHAGRVATAAPIDVAFSNFRISTLSRFAGQDSLPADGILNGKATIKDVLTSPVFTSDLKIRDLSYKGDAIGDFAIKVNNQKADAYSADISLTGNQNDVRVSGDYYARAGRMDMKLDMGQLNLAIVRPFTGDQLKDVQGFLKGRLSVTGTLEKPVLDGNLHFDSTRMTPLISGEPLKLSNDNIEFDKDGFNVSHFAFADASGNQATIDGNVFTSDYRNYSLALFLNANNFRLVNAPKAGKRQIYGKMNLDASVNIKGDMKAPLVDGFIRANKQTDFTFVLPSSDPEVVDREGVVRFIDHLTDSLSNGHKDTVMRISRQTNVKGMDISLKISTDSSARFTMIIDERSGDALTARGRSDLVFNMNENGKMDLTGTYEVESGSYNLVLDVLKRKFDIVRGSTITWTGDPTSGNMNISATYTVNTPPIDLVSNEIAGRNETEINKFKHKLPFLVVLKMEGDLMKPKITFDITLPPGVLANWPDVDSKLQQLRVQESEMNKQVFALMLINRFVGQDPFQSAAGGGTSVGGMAFQSASQLLTGQLDRLAAGLVKGVDIHFDLASQQDYSTGQQQNYTAMGVSVSRKLFNDRIQVQVGSNVDVPGAGNTVQNASTLAGNAAVDYKLSPDGRYMIRAYSRNQYEMVVEGQVVETGVSFILTLDYNKFRELFSKSNK